MKHDTNATRSSSSSHCTSLSMIRKFRVMIFFVIVGITTTTTNVNGLNIRPSSTTTTTTKTTTTTTTSLPFARRYYDSDKNYNNYLQNNRNNNRNNNNNNNNNHGNIERERSTSNDRPTKTVLEEIGPKSIPSKPKIVVLGASGKVGRFVVQQLLEQNSKNNDVTVVAVVRNYDKAIKVLYDGYYETKVSRSVSGGPKLQIVKCNLIPQEELPGWDPTQDPDWMEEEQLWKETAESAALFRGNTIQEYDNRDLLPDINEALEDAIQDCTTIISCVGTVRPTNLWTDLLARPIWRLLQPDVSTWCKDGRHPYYVNYVTTRKAVGYAEREQLRREAAAASFAEEKEEKEEQQNGDDTSSTIIHVPKIRFVRLSDLNVGQNPWNFIPLIANAFQSMVFRYHEMAEQLLEQSTLLETVIIRPGDLVDEERDVNTTSLQVSHTGMVPFPSRVGREDVASLMVAAALFPSRNQTRWNNDKHRNKVTSDQSDGSPPLHYTLGVRWVGQDMAPFPAQGYKSQGLATAEKCMKQAIRHIERNQGIQQQQEERRRRRRRQGKQGLIVNGSNQQKVSTTTTTPSTSHSDTVLRMAQQMKYRRGKLKPYGICTAIPVYLFLFLLAKTLIRPAVPYIPGGQTYIIPAIYQANELVKMGIRYIYQKGMILIPLLTKRPKYIYL